MAAGSLRADFEYLKVQSGEKPSDVTASARASAATVISFGIPVGWSPIRTRGERRIRSASEERTHDH
jgi:hypothetical protein